MKKMLLVMLVCCCPLFAQDNVAVAVRGVELLRNHLRDPNSLIIERIYVLSKSVKAPICIRYRSRNGFGGYVREMAEYKGGDNLDSEPEFSRCPGLLADVDQSVKDRAIKKGWVDITDEYLKVTMPAAKDARAK